MEIFMALPKYELTEPFYDNLVLWDSGDVIEWEGVPSPSMIPLNKEAAENMEKYMKSKGENYEYVPPVSELADTMDGQRNPHNDFHPGNRKNNVNAKRGAMAAGFPATPGAANSAVTGAKGTRNAAPVVTPPMSQMPQMPVKPNKNFDRAPK
jgi:hypothetical protein